VYGAAAFPAKYNASCVDNAATSGCTCSITDTNTDNVAAAPYTISGSTVTTDPGTANARTYDFCVTGTTLKYKETTAGADPNSWTSVKH
jgi:hypothetical protein